MLPARLFVDSPDPSDRMTRESGQLLSDSGSRAFSRPLCRSGPSFVARAIQTRRPNPAKLEPYESGIAPSTTAFDTRFSVRYFLIAVLFVVFDVETIFLFPWAVMFHRLGLFGLIEMLIFLDHPHHRLLLRVAPQGARLGVIHLRARRPTDGPCREPLRGKRPDDDGRLRHQLGPAARRSGRCSSASPAARSR